MKKHEGIYPGTFALPVVDNVNAFPFVRVPGTPADEYHWRDSYTIGHSPHLGWRRKNGNPEYWISTTCPYQSYFDVSGQGFYLELPIHKDLITLIDGVRKGYDLIPNAVRVFAYNKWGYVEFDDESLWQNNDWEIRFYLADPGDKWDFYKVEMFPNKNAHASKYTIALVASMNDYRLLTAHPTQLADYYFVQFGAMQKPNQVPGGLSTSLKPPGYQWAAALTWFQVHVWDDDAEVWRKYCLPYNSSHPSKPSDSFNSSTVLYDSAKGEDYFVIASGDTPSQFYNHSTKTWRHSKMERLNISRTLSYTGGYNLWNPKDWYEERIPIGEWVSDIFDDIEDEDEEIEKQMMLSMTLIFTKVQVVDLVWNTPEWDIASMYLPFPMWKGWNQIVPSSLDWPYDPTSDKTQSTYGELILDGVALILAGLLIYIIGKYSAKIAKKILAKWKKKRATKKQLKAINAVADRIEDMVLDMQDSVAEVSSLYSIIEDVNRKIDVVSASLDVKTFFENELRSISLMLATAISNPTRRGGGYLNEIFSRIDNLL